MVHANGDAAIDLTVAAFEKALGTADRRDLRHRIEHCSIADDGHFRHGGDRRIAELPDEPRLLLGRALRDHILGADRAPDGLGSQCAAHGLRPSFHSDYSVSRYLRCWPCRPRDALASDGSMLNPRGVT